MFRIKKIVVACTDSPKFSYWISIICLAVGIILVTVFYEKFPGLYYKYDHKSQVILVWSVYLMVFILPNSIYSWLKNKNILYEPENYFILVVFAVFTSVNFGLMSYSLQMVNPSSYIIDINLVNEEYLDLKCKNEQDILNVKRNILKVETLYKKAIKNYKSNNHIKEIDRKEFLGHNEYYYTFDDIKIKLSKRYYRLARNMYVTYHYMELSCDTNWVEVQISKKDYPFPHHGVEKAVISYLKKRKDIEKVPLYQMLNDSTEIEKKKFNLSVSLYIYDALMGVLGNNTGYFKPYSHLGRVIEIFKTLFKFFYVSYFVSFAVKRYSAKDQ